MNRRSRLVSASLALVLAAGASAQWNPNAGQWGKSDPRDVRVMTWNVLDGICRTNNKVEDLNNWAALARIVAAMKPDILLLQETGDNAGNGTGSGVDSTSQLNTTLGYFFNGGNDSFKSNAPITSWVKKYAPTFDMPYVYVSFTTDGFNRNIVLSRFPFTDLTGDTFNAISTWSSLPDLYAPGGTPGIRGFIFAEINLPDADYAGNLVVGTAHLRSGGTASDKQERLVASQNIAYYIDYMLNGGGTSTPDPRGMILDSPAATLVPSATTPAIWGGDFNEDENSNGRDGPAWWMTKAAVNGGTDGTDRDRTDATFDDARDFFTNNRSTQSSSKLDYICWQDSIATLRRSFIFNSVNCNSTTTPPELVGYVGGFSLCTSFASDHRPVIADFILPAAVTQPGPFNLLTPADNTVNTSLTTSLTWSPSSNATSYTVKVSLSPDLSSPIVNAGGLAGTSYVIGGGVLAECGQYYWGVTAVNTAGSRASTPASFGFRTSFPADLTGDGFVNGDDYDLFASYFESGDLGADINGDTFVNGDDFDAFASHFEAGC
ncbi:MAG: endonuclease/exonuclease/phosphatase family protein [Phycisphaerales bacterium]|nr:endonuclease/exonuclease/phosphatase family protein [Phycisphaerales bacterium]